VFRLSCTKTLLRVQRASMQLVRRKLKVGERAGSLSRGGRRRVVNVERSFRFDSIAAGVATSLSTS
jgi:hypothetical protein